MQQLEKIRQWKEYNIKFNEMIDQVKILTKKDGSEFSIFSKNFNFPVVKDSGLIQHNVLQLGQYKIDLTHTLEKDKEGNYFDTLLNKNVDPSRVVKEPCIKPYYNLNVEETKEILKIVYEKNKTYISEYEKMESDYNYFLEQVQDLTIKEIKEFSASKSSSFKYLITNFLNNWANSL